MNIRENNHLEVVANGVAGVGPIAAARSQLQLEYQGKNQTKKTIAFVMHV
jgi:hypothetical protein